MKIKQTITTLGIMGLGLTLISGYIKKRCELPEVQRITNQKTPELDHKAHEEDYHSQLKKKSKFGNGTRYAVRNISEDWTIKSKTQKISEYEQFTHIGYEIILNMPDISQEPIDFQGNIILFGNNDENKLELQSMSHYNNSRNPTIPEGKIILTPKIQKMAANVLNKTKQLGDNHEYNTPLITELVDEIYTIRQRKL